MTEAERRQKVQTRRTGWLLLAGFLTVETLMILLVASGSSRTASMETPHPAAYWVGYWGGALVIGFILWLVGAIVTFPLTVWFAGQIPVRPARTPKAPRQPKPVEQKETADELIRRLRAEKRERHRKDLETFDRIFKAYEGKEWPDEWAPPPND